jgi:hypothetical protein
MRRRVRQALVWIVALLAMCAVGCDEPHPPSDDRTLTLFAFRMADNPGLSLDVFASIDGEEVRIRVPVGTDVTTLRASFQLEGDHAEIAGLVQDSGETVHDFTSAVTFSVVSGRGLRTDYRVFVSPGDVTANELTAFRFADIGNPALTSDFVGSVSGDDIVVHVPPGTDVSALIATFETNAQAVHVNGVWQRNSITPNDFSAPVTYVVTAAVGSSRTYNVTVLPDLPTDKEIVAFGFTAALNPGLAKDVVGTISGNDITVIVPLGTPSSLVATFTTTGQSVTVGGTTQVSGTTVNNFMGTVLYDVTAADQSQRSYTVHVQRVASDDKDLTAFSFRDVNNPTLDLDVIATINGTAITATIPAEAEPRALVATFTTTGVGVKVGTGPGAVTQTSGVTLNDFKNPVTYTVYAQDQSTKTYTVTVTVAPPAWSAKELTSFALLDASNAALSVDVTGSIIGTQVRLVVPGGTNRTALVATFAHSGASVSVGATTQTSGVTPNDFTNPVTYVVTAENGSTHSYVVTVAYESSWTGILQMGSTGYDRINDSAVDTLGNVYVVGGAGASLFGETFAGGNSDAFIAKISPAGALVWGHLISGIPTVSGTDEIAWGVAIDASGTVVVAGTASNVVFGSFLVTYSSAGTRLQTRRLGETSLGFRYRLSASNQLVAIPNGDIAVCGHGDTGGFKYDVVVERISADLQTSRWQRNLSASSVASLYCGGLDVYADGSFALAAHSFGPASHTVVYKLYAGGTPVANWPVHLVDNVYPRDVVALSNGGLAFVGATSEAMFNGESTQGGSDAVIAVVSSSGAVSWGHPVGGAGDEAGYALASDGAGGLVMVATTNSTLYPGASGGDDVAVIRYDATGALTWGRQLGQSGADGGTSVAVFGSSAFVCGFTDGALAATNAGADDVFVASYDQNGTLQ